MVTSSHLTVAAEGYCEYALGLSIASQGIEQAQKLAEQELNVVHAAQMAVEYMYSGAQTIVRSGLEAHGGMHTSTTQKDHPSIDRDISAFAIEAIDYAHDTEHFANRIHALGKWTLEQSIVRPCILKDPPGAYMVRRSRADKLTIERLALGRVNKDFAVYADHSITELRRRAKEPVTKSYEPICRFSC